MRIDFRPLGADDLPLLHLWLCREHVRRWWGEPGTLEDVAEHYLPAIEGRDPTDLFAIVVDDEPIGLVQLYLVVENPAYAARVGGGAETAALDLLIGEPAFVGRGVGTQVIRAFVDRVVFAREDVQSCVADPDVRNEASIRAFEKAGFTRMRDYHDPGDGHVQALMRIERGRAGAERPEA